MATATKTPPDLNDATERIVKFNERFVEAGKRAGSLYLDSYDRLVEGAVALQEKLAEQSQSDAVKSIVARQVEMTRELASAYTAAARELIA